MNCKSVQAYLSAYLDGELSGHESIVVRDHLGRCPDCRAEEQQLRSLKHLLQGLPTYQPSPDFEDRLVSRVRGADSVRRYRFQIDWRLAGGFAMASALAAFAVFKSGASPIEPANPTAIARMDGISLDLARDQLFMAGNDPLSGNRFASYGVHDED